MPELPEVESARRLAERHLLEKTIEKVHTVPDAIVYQDVTPARFARALTGRKVQALCRKGKQLWMELDRPPSPGFHFGMTGSFHVYTSPSDRPRFWKVELLMDDGTRLCFRNVRRLGRLRLLHDPTAEPPVSRLGFDPLYEMPSVAAFSKAVRRRATPIKALLLNQSFAAGVGNWIADEVLYQARIDPRRSCTTLDSAELRRLHSALGRVIHTAVKADADKDRFPKTWLFHARWGKSATHTVRGEPIQFDTVAGRTTAWVPTRQT